MTGISKDTFDKIINTSAVSNDPLDENAIREVAVAAGLDPDAAVKDHHRKIYGDEGEEYSPITLG